MNFISNFEESVLRAARERGLDGVICGHIHWATIREVDHLTYANCGDWVDSCTAILEHFDGRLELVRWTQPTLTPASAARSDALSTGDAWTNAKANLASMPIAAQAQPPESPREHRVHGRAN